ncbi:hypothetical protein ACOSQ4_008145 [Xanthoceras sorbifolium]
MKTFVSGAVEAADHHHVVEMKSLAPASTCFASTKGLYGMQIVHRYGPCTPLGQENPSPDSHHILIKDQARVRSINSKTSNKYATYDHDGLRTRLTVKAETFQPHTMTLFGRDIGAGNYIVKAGFGTPKREFNLIFDTGSDVTWLKCVSNGGYQPSASSTSTNATCNPGSNCSFTINYVDKSTRVNDSQVCGAFAGNDDVPDKLTIIGNHQQRTLNVLFNIQDNKVEFGNGGCAN